MPTPRPGPSTVQLRLRVYRGEEAALGPGRAELLARIGETGSVAQATRDMGMFVHEGMEQASQDALRALEGRMAGLLRAPEAAEQRGLKRALQVGAASERYPRDQVQNSLAWRGSHRTQQRQRLRQCLVEQQADAPGLRDGFLEPHGGVSGRGRERL